MGVDLTRSASGVWTVRPVAPWEPEQWHEAWEELGRRVDATTSPFALLADASSARPPSALERRVVAGFFRDHAEGLARSCVGMSVVVSNPVIRAAATAVFWIAGPPVDVAFHTRHEDAESRLLGLLAASSAA